MYARVTTAFPGLPDGETIVKNFEPGDIVKGDLAAVAIDEGLADEIDDVDAEAEASGDHEAEQVSSKRQSKRRTKE